MQNYLELGFKIATEGNIRPDRTGTGTRSMFGQTLRFDLREGFPLLTSKKMFLKAIIKELLWFLKGSTNNNDLVKEGVTIWDEWATPSGDLGPIYGKQWRSWDMKDQPIKIPYTVPERLVLAKKIIDEQENRDFDMSQQLSMINLISSYWTGTVVLGEEIAEETERQIHKQLDTIKFPGIPHDIPTERDGFVTIDQIAEVIANLKARPFSRRHVVSAWNPADLPDERVSPQENVYNGKMCLATCHCLFQFYAAEMTLQERLTYARDNGYTSSEESRQIQSEVLAVVRKQLGNTNNDQANVEERKDFDKRIGDLLDEKNVPKLWLDQQLYQR